jgi:hypothetical protein
MRPMAATHKTLSYEPAANIGTSQPIAAGDPLGRTVTRLSP